MPDIPLAVQDLDPGQSAELVWHNELGGLTYRLADRYVKWNPQGNGIDLDAEADRLAWARCYASVPVVLGRGADSQGSWLVTAALPGDSAVSEQWIARPEIAVRALGVGLRALHERLPVRDCPFSWSASDRLRNAVTEPDPARWDPVHRHLDVAAALAVLADPPPNDRAVVCHGDACAPNTLLLPDGTWSAHVDLGALGVADRWADLAIATWSTQWNYGPGWESLLLESYGVEPDPVRTAYYRLLWDLT